MLHTKPLFEGVLHTNFQKKIVRSILVLWREKNCSIDPLFLYFQSVCVRETPCMALCFCYACFCRSLGPVSLSTELTKSVCLLVPRRRNQMALPRTRQHLIKKNKTRQQGLSCPDSHTDTQVFLVLDISCKHWLVRKRFLATTMCYPN